MRLLSLFLLSSFVALGQQSLPTLEAYFQKISSQYPCTFSYDSDLLGNAPLIADTTAASLDEYLSWLGRNSAFKFTRSEGDLILVEPKVPGANTVVRINAKAESGEKINELSVQSRRSSVKQQQLEGTSLVAYLNYSSGDTLVVISEFYAAQKIAVDDLLQKKEYPVLLKEDVRLLSEVTVTGYMTTGVNYKKQSQEIEVDLESLPALPGQTDGDILNALEAMPGITSADGKAGSLLIRGSTSDQSYLMYDNIPIYHKGHFFGTISPYNPLSVDKVNVSRSVFSADKGGRVGGAIEIVSRKNYKDSTSFDLNLSTTYAGACIRMPIVKKKLGIMIAARSSYPIRYETPKLKAISNFIYQESEVNKARIDPSVDLNHLLYGFNDINVKLGGELGKRDQWHISFLSINNHVRIETFEKQRKVQTHDDMLLYNNGFDIGYEHRWSRKVKTNLNITNSYFTQKFYSDEIQMPQDSLRFSARFANRLTDHSVRLETEWKATERVSLQGGYEFKNHSVVNFTYHTSAQVKDSNETTNLFVHAGFANFNYSIKRKLYTTTGLRAVYNTFVQQWFLEPRLNASYILSKKASLKAAAGLFNQFLVQVSGVSIENVGGIENSNWQAADGNAIPVISSKQVSAGTIITPGRNFVLDIEGYYKYVDNITINNFVNFKSPNKYLYGSTETFGVDVMVKKKIKRLETWVSYTLSESTMHFDSAATPDMVWIWDQPHVIDLAAMCDVWHFRFSAIWKYRTGLDALDGVRVKMLAGPPSSGVTGGGGGPPPPPPPPPGGGSTQTDAIEEYKDRYPDFHQLDISVVYLFPSKNRWKASLGLSLMNVYDQKNVLVQMKRPNTTTFINKYAQGFAPNLQFNLSY